MKKFLFLLMAVFLLFNSSNSFASYPTFAVDTNDYGNVPFDFNGHHYINFVLTAGYGGSTVLIYNYFDENVRY